MNLSFIFALISLISIPQTYANTYYLNSVNGSDSYNGSQSFPLLTLEYAVSNADSEPDSEFILEGIFNDSTIFITDKSATFRSNPESVNTTTIHQGLSNDTIFFVENSTVLFKKIYFQREEIATDTINTSYCPFNAGSIVINSSVVNFDNVTMYGFCAQGFAGALDIDNSDVNISNSFFDHNTVFFYDAMYSSGGAIYAERSNITVVSSNFSFNSVELYGGAISFVDCSINVSNSYFEENTAQNIAVDPSTGGGAIYTEDVVGYISKSSFIENIGTSGGAIFHKSGSLTIENNHFFSNVVNSYGPAIHLFNPISPYLAKAQVNLNDFTCNSQLQFQYLPICVSPNREFVPESVFSAQLNFVWSSPCPDQGIPENATCPNKTGLDTTPFYNNLVCSKCHPGSHYFNTVSLECPLCLPGHYQNNANQSTCPPCAAKSYQPNSGQSFCLSCDTQTETGQTKCPPPPDIEPPGAVPGTDDGTVIGTTFGVLAAVALVSGYWYKYHRKRGHLLGSETPLSLLTDDDDDDGDSFSIR